MNKTQLKEIIKSFATNCVFASIMFTLFLTYLMYMALGQGAAWVLIVDFLCFVGDSFLAVRDWKDIKLMLEESE
jgi:hypothetical protein